jgi:hypothetical protein
MKIRNMKLATLVVAGMASACASEPAGSQAQSQEAALHAVPASAASNRREGVRRMALRDDCDPTDPTWAPSGGCLLPEGDVNRTEFNALLNSPLSTATVGHPAWRIDPTYTKFDGSRTIVVTNAGGRLHTFTEVANFGGGRVPPLNKGLTPAPECVAADPKLDVAPAGTLEVTGLAVGNHRFQCCIHPWMRALVKVKPPGDDED